MDLNAIQIFVKVVQAGSFVQAARQLGIPSSTASAKLSALERRLGVTLLQRTTRKLHLTEMGGAYFRHCLRALDEIQEIEVRMNSSRLEPEGILKVTAPVDLGNTCLTPLISTFRKKYPKVSLEFIFSDQLIDLVAQGIDIAIRAGKLKDSGLISKKLGLSYWLPFASPSYLKRSEAPLQPKDLEKHECIQFMPFGDDHWELSKGSSTVRVPIRRSVGGNDINLTKALCIAGHGITLLPTFACHSEIKSGKLIRILPEWNANTDPIQVVYPDQKFVPPKVRAFVDVAVEEFKSIL